MLKVFVKSEILHACGWWASGSLDPGPNMSQSDWQSLNINHTFNIFSRTGERPCGQALWESVRIEGGEGPPPFLSPASSAVLLLRGRGVEPSQSLTSLFFWQLFQGNIDNNSHKKNLFEPPFYARFVRVVPWEWHERITLRMELLGCDAWELPTLFWQSKLVLLGL